MKIALGPKPQPGETDTRKLYPVKVVEELSLLDLLTLERESEATGRKLTLTELDRMEESIAAAQREAIRGLDAKAAAIARHRAGEEHPDAIWLFAVMLWASRRGAGDVVTFDEAISTPLNEVDVISEAGDRGADPTRRRRASSAGAKKQAKDRGGKTT